MANIPCRLHNRNGWGIHPWKIILNVTWFPKVQYSTFQFLDCADSSSAAAVSNLEYTYHELDRTFRLVEDLTEKIARDAGASNYDEWRDHGLLPPTAGVKALDYELHRVQLVKAIGDLKLLLVDSTNSILKAYFYYAENPGAAQDVCGDDLIVFQHNLMCLGKLLVETLYCISLHYVRCEGHYQIVTVLNEQYETVCDFIEGKDTLKKDGILSQAQWYNAKGSDWHAMIRAVQSDASISKCLTLVIVAALRNLIRDGGLGQARMQLIGFKVNDTDLLEPLCEWFTQAGWNVSIEHHDECHNARLVLLPM